MQTPKEYENLFLKGLPIEKIVSALNAAPGAELKTGKFASPESSAALAANTFGLFIDAPEKLPPIPGTEKCAWPAETVNIERNLRFPWSGGLHPWLDAVIETKSCLIGVESKRFEPFRSQKSGSFSDAYWRPVWGDNMKKYEELRDILHKNPNLYQHLNAVQLIKHALGIRTQAVKRKLRGILYYLYAEPIKWPNAEGGAIAVASRGKHAAEAKEFAKQMSGEEVSVICCSYREFLRILGNSPFLEVRQHALAIEQRFAP